MLDAVACISPGMDETSTRVAPRAGHGPRVFDGKRSSLLPKRQQSPITLVVNVVQTLARNVPVRVPSQ
jgi:hypothetical protein